MLDHKRSNGRSFYRKEEGLTLLRNLVVVVPCGPRLRAGNPVTGLFLEQENLKIAEAWRQLLVIKGKVGAIITFKSKVRMAAKSPQSALDMASVVLRMAVEDHHVERARLPD